MNGWQVSVIIPVYCGEEFIADALASIAAQTVPVREIIVIDDGSTDKTAEIVKQYPADNWPAGIRYIYQENRGPHHARNHGLQLAAGNAIAFLDADDTWRPGKLADQLPKLDNADVVIGRTVIMDATGGVPFVLPSLCCALFRKSAFDRIGHFDPDLEFSDDMDWYLRARENGLGIKLHGDVVLEHRRHGANLTRDTDRKQRFHLLMLHKSIMRRREKIAASAPQLPCFNQRESRKAS